MTALVSFDCGEPFPLGPLPARSISGHLKACSSCATLDHLLDVRGEAYADVAVCNDLDVKRLNRHPNIQFPVEVSGDALALWRAAQPHQDSHQEQQK